ncbi:uncharacterized protein LOC143848848 [Tasmannia lanceolata]|uniref:uncharacterized protein LOC143848848 n=1 Tax=Tasmannia lanceolata TaxID=3420 RepID=UPI0040649CC3
MMNCQKNIEVKVLSEQDSWNLFKEKVGVVETDELQSLAREVAKECKGLPLTIVTVARALKGRGPIIWANALQELRWSSPIELSYNCIESEEAKLCFLFCCVFPEDHDIEVGVLTRYMMGERDFKDVNNFEEAWNRIHTLVEKLKDSCLLLDGDKKGCVKMHDVVRDVAKLIASRKEHGFLVKVGVELTEWPENLDECRRLSLMGTSIGMLPEQPNCPSLLTLLLQRMNGWNEIPNNFFEGMKALVVLDLSNTEISALPPSLSSLKNLKTLCLDECQRLRNISELGGLEKLEVLSLRDTAIKELPIEMGQLSNLKVLDLTSNHALTMVAPNVISRLSKLEELYMGGSFSEWEVRGSRGDGSKASFDEVASLTRLTVLYIHVKDLIFLSLEVPGPWEKLKKFGICVRGGLYSFSHYDKCTSITLTSNSISKWVKLLLERSEEIYLESVSNINIVHLLDDEGVSFKSVKSVKALNINFFRKLKNILSYDQLEGLQCLEKLKVENCPELEEVFHYEEGIREEIHAAITTSPFSTLKEMVLCNLPKLSCIWKGAIPPTGTFHNLTHLTVSRCPSLRCLFSPVLAQCLQQLKYLNVQQCEEIEVIIIGEEEEQDKESLLPQLETIDLRQLPKLTSLCCHLNRGGGGGGSHVFLDFPSLKSIWVYACPNLKRFPVRLNHGFKDWSGRTKATCDASNLFLIHFESDGNCSFSLVGVKEDSRGGPLASQLKASWTLLMWQECPNRRYVNLVEGFEELVESNILDEQPHLVEELVESKVFYEQLCFDDYNDDDGDEIICNDHDETLLLICLLFLPLLVSSLRSLVFSNIMDVLLTLIIEAVKSSFGPLKRCVDYLVHYKRSVENLKLKAENLRLRRDVVQRLVDAAYRRGEEITGEVQLWLQQVDDIEAITKRLDEGMRENKRCFKGWCPNFSSRYSLGKEPTKKTVDVDGLLARGNFTHVSTLLPSPTFNPPGEFEPFESTESTKKLIIKALKEERINIIGVYGMGGVGKTTLVEQVGKQAKDEKLCDEVVKVTVSQNQDLHKIQGELAEKLGMELKENNEEGRAGRLLGRLKQEKKVLIILDDLWDRLDLTKVGIPCGGTQKGCQIIMTTRRLDVCSTMNCQKKIEVQVLPEQDSWNLFKEKAEIVETDELHSLAWEVAKECKGLPLAIVTVARALKGKGSSIWANALQELKRSSPRNIEGVDKEVYSRLELSYNYIGSEEAKLCFLFCCVFPEDHNIEVGVLMRYMMGERDFKDVNNFEEAWNRIHTLVEKLKDSCLLLDGDKKGCVKMHDVVRDVAILIASRKEHGFLVKVGVELTEWPENLDECKRLSLMGTSIGMLPKPPNCPRLLTLLLQRMNGWEEISNNSIEGMKAIIVMDLSNTEISSLPPSLPYLKNLKTLCLDYCQRLDDISLLGGLEKLEVLSLRETMIQELPVEIGQLSNLKVLDLTGSGDLTMVAPNVISRLSKLEELYMGDSFNEWEVRGSRGDGSKASFDEVASLARLTTLYIHVKDVNCLSLEVPGHWEKLKKFRICVWEERYSSSDYEKCTSINIMSYPVSKWVKLLLERSEGIELKRVRVPVSNIVHLLNDGVSFNSVKRLNLYDCDEMEHFINTVEESHRVPPNAFRILQRLDLYGMEKLEKICHGPLPNRFFRNLIQLNIIRCGKLKNILSYDLLEGLKSLEKLKVDDCEELEEVFQYEEIHAITTSPLSTLKEMELRYLPKLSCIWKGVIPPPLTFQNLRRINIETCPRLKDVFSWNIARGLQQLEYLSVYECEEIEVIISGEEEEQELGVVDKESLLPRLETIYLRELPKLRSVCCHLNRGGGSHVFLDFPSLISIWVSYCPNVKRFPVRPHNAPNLEMIQGEEAWFEGLEWEDEGDMSRLIPLFDPYQW